MLLINSLETTSHFLKKKRWILFVSFIKSRTFAPTKHRGVEQLVARWAHNPKVIRSSRISATIMRIISYISAFYPHFN